MAGDGVEITSMVASVVAAIVALVTLATVYTAVVQIQTRRQNYRLGVSRKSLGPWKNEVVVPSFLRMQTQINTPFIRINDLIRIDWRTDFSHPKGFIEDPKKSKRARRLDDPEAYELLPSEDYTLAESSWVNFLQLAGVKPQGRKISQAEPDAVYSLESQSELINGVFPMRWKGPTLVAFCSMTGFQSSENVKNGEAMREVFRRPMTLPLQWSGPAGTMQFRASSDGGCLVEFSRRPETQSAFNHEKFQAGYALYKPRQTRLADRLWYAASGLPLDNGKSLYLGGTDDWVKRRTRGQAIDPSKLEESEGGPALDELLSSLDDSPTMSDEELRKKMKVSASAPTSKRRSSTDELLEKLEKFREKIGSTEDDEEKATKDTVACFTPSPGLVSIIWSGEFAEMHGLNTDPKSCLQFCTGYFEKNKVDREKYPFSLPRHYFDLETAGLLKRAFLYLVPDGYYFSPSIQIYKDIRFMIGNISKILMTDYDLPFVFKGDDPEMERAAEHLKERAAVNTKVNLRTELLIHTMKLCNEVQRIDMEERWQFSVEDIQLISTAHVAVREILDNSIARVTQIIHTPSPDGSAPMNGGSNTSSSFKARDLVWALIATPDLFPRLLTIFSKGGVLALWQGKVRCTDRKLHVFFHEELGNKDSETDVSPLEFSPESPLIFSKCHEIEFSGDLLVTAFMDVFLLHIWLFRPWISNVAAYNGTIPQTVMMA